MLISNIAIPKPKLARDWKKFFASVHRQRTYMINSGVSQKCLPRMQGILDRLQPYVNYNWTNQGAAQFILKHKGEIRELISERSNVTIARMDLFVTQADFFINPKIS